MVKRFSPLMAVLVLLVMVTSVTQAQTRSIVWERWDVVIDDIDTTENVFIVTEIYDIRFFGTFRFGQAVIPLERVNSIDNVQVWLDGQPLQQGCLQRTGTYCVDTTVEGLSIVYNFFSPITDRSANIVIEYRVNGGLRVYPDGDQLWWIGVTEEKYGYAVNASTIRVNLPPEYAPRPEIDPVVTYGAQANVTVEGSTVIATAINGVNPDEAFEIRVQYPHNTNARVAVWQASFDEQRAFDETVRPWIDIGTLLGGFLLALFGPAFTYYRWFTRGRDPKIGPVPQYISERPSDLPPALVGTLVDENAELRDIVSTLIDLADRGYLSIEESDKAQFHFRRLNESTEGLRKYEAYFINRFFGKKDTVSLSTLKNKFYTHIPKLQTMVYEELVKEGMFKQSPEQVRSGWIVLGAFLLMGGIGFSVVLFELAESMSYALMCLPAGIVISGLAMLVAASAMPSKTQKGAEEAAKWNAFREYMRNLQQYQDVESAAQNFSRFLPYAVAFGFERSWIKRFEKVDTVGMPPWYYPRHYRRRGVWGTGGVSSGPFTPSAADVRPGDLARAGGGGLDDLSGGLSSGLSSISDGLTRMLNSASSTLNSRPQAQSGSSGSWGGGGGSFSGGGSFGGGGGGGGSRGFG